MESITECACGAPVFLRFHFPRISAMICAKEKEAPLPNTPLYYIMPSSARNWQVDFVPQPSLGVLVPLREHLLLCLLLAPLAKADGNTPH